MTVHNTLTDPVWLFDLDNTLHDAAHAIFPTLHDNMHAYMTRVLQAQGHPAHYQEVDRLRSLYWSRYGATLLGLMRHHNVCADDFLRETHTFDNLVGMIRAERGLIRLLKGLPGKKILLTNAPQAYANDVVRHLGLHRFFAKSLSIESMYVHGQLRPKPSRQLLRKVLAREGVAAHRCVLVEDTVVNLRAAKQEGMHTVWMTRYLATNRASQLKGLGNTIAMRPHYVDMTIHSIRELHTYARRLLNQHC